VLNPQELVKSGHEESDASVQGHKHRWAPTVVLWCMVSNSYMQVRTVGLTMHPVNQQAHPSASPNTFLELLAHHSQSHRFRGAIHQGSPPWGCPPCCFFRLEAMNELVRVQVSYVST